MAQPLGRVLRDDDLTGPRGPDGRLRVRVPASWLSEGARIELDLPRMLACASCDGGGCDGCGRSGGVETRGRKEPAEIVDLELPPSEKAVTVRLPRRGGLGTEGQGRGVLLLTVAPGEPATDGVRKLERPEPPQASSPEAPLAPPSPTPWWVWVIFLVALGFALFVLSR